MPQDFAHLTARQQIEDEIERLIAILDAMEPDDGFEENGDREPWLGWAEDRRGVLDTGDDREGDWSDDEPSLGAPEAAFHGPYCGSSVKLQIMRNQRPDLWDGQAERSSELSQVNWANGADDDREDQCEDEGAICPT